MSNFNILRRFYNWLRKPIEVTIWHPKQGMIKEIDLPEININGRIWKEEEKSRKIFSFGDSQVVTVDPEVIPLLCPNKTRDTHHTLLKEMSGQYVLMIRGHEEEKA